MWTPTKTDTGQILTLREWRGVDLWHRPTALPPNVLSRSENTDFQRGEAERRAGAVKVAQLAVQGTNGASRTFGADTKYAKVSANSALLIPIGGFFALWHFVATRGASTGWLFSSRQTGQTYGVLWAWLTTGGLLEVFVRWTNNSTTTLTTAALADGSTQHAFLIYDDVLGTLKLYLNGDVAASETPGASLQPNQTAGIDWYFGVEWNPSTPGVSANTHFDGRFDGFTLGTLRGLRPASGDVTFQETARRLSACVWPTPQMDCILAHYDMDEASGTVMYDRSNRKNHGVYVGGPSVSLPVAQLSAPCHHIGRIVRADGTFNQVGSWGSLFYQPVGGLA